MAHEISFANGRHEVALALKPAWHGLGTVLDHVPDSAGMLAAAGLDWTVELRPVFTTGPDGFQEIPDRRASVRADNSRILGVVGDSYGLVQNFQAFGWIDSLLQDGIMRYESAGALKGGRIVWCLARMPSEQTIGDSNDAIRNYLLFVTSHDGSMRLRVTPTTERVVCRNTLNLALSQELRGVSLRHTSGVQVALERARDHIASFDRLFTRFGVDANKLRATTLTRPLFESILDKLFPMPSDPGRARSNWEKRMLDITDRMRNPRQQLAGSNLWGLYNAISESLDHASVFRGQGSDRAENRMLSLMAGSVADQKREAFALALSLAS